MAKVDGSATAIPRFSMRKLAVGGNDTVHDQVRAEIDQQLKTLLDNMVALNPGMWVHQIFSVSSSASVVANHKIRASSKVHVLGFNASGVSNALGITAAAADADQVANPGKINLTGNNAAGTILVLYQPKITT